MRRTVRRPIPETWESIPTGRRLSVIRELLLSEGITGRVHALRVMLELPKSVWFNLTPLQIADLLDRTPWLTAEPSPIPMLPFFVWNGEKYHLPADNFTNGKCVEFPMADDYLKQFLQKNEAEGLLKMVAVLCREENPNRDEVLKNGDARVPLNSKMEVEQRAKRLQKLPQEIQVAVMLYFIGVKFLIDKMYGDWLFERKKPLAEGEEPDETPTKKADPLHWWGMYLDAAEGDITKLDRIHQSNFHTFCTMEARRRKARKEAEMQQKLHTPHTEKHD